MKDALKEIGLGLAVFIVGALLLIACKYLLIYVWYLIRQLIAWIA